MAPLLVACETGGDMTGGAASDAPDTSVEGSRPQAEASEDGGARQAARDDGSEHGTDASSRRPSAAGAGSRDASAAVDAGEMSRDAGRTADASTSAPDAGTEGGHLCDVGVYDGTPPQALTLSGDTFAHDPTMIEAAGVYYRFWTGDQIPMATSTDLKSWRNGPAVYRDGYPSWVGEWLAGVPDETFNFPWAPDVSYFGGRYHLYSSFSARFGDNVSCITHLTTSDIASGQWTDHGPVICSEGDEPYNAIDADIGTDADGTPWMAFGSFWDGIMLAELDADGRRAGTELTRVAWAREIEAPVLFRRCGYYYLFVTWGLCCPGAGRSVGDLSYRVAVGRSRSIRGPYVDREGTPLLEGGGTLIVQGDGANYAAAGHSDVIVAGDTIYHLYHAYRLPTGGAELRIVELPFDDQGWPVPGGP